MRPARQVRELQPRLAAAVQRIGQLDLVLDAGILVEEIRLKVVQRAVGAGHDHRVHGQTLQAQVLGIQEFVDDPRGDRQTVGADHVQGVHLVLLGTQADLFLQELGNVEDDEHRVDVVHLHVLGLLVDKIIIEDIGEHLLLLRFLQGLGIDGQVEAEQLADLHAAHLLGRLARKEVLHRVAVRLLDVFAQQPQALAVAGHEEHLDEEGEHHEAAQHRDHGGDLHFHRVLLQFAGHERYDVPDVRRNVVEVIPYVGYGVHLQTVYFLLSSRAGCLRLSRCTLRTDKTIATTQITTRATATI